MEGLKQQGSRITDTPEEKMENVEVQTAFIIIQMCLSVSKIWSLLNADWLTMGQNRKGRDIRVHWEQDKHKTNTADQKLQNNQHRQCPCVSELRNYPQLVDETTTAQSRVAHRSVLPHTFTNEVCAGGRVNMLPLMKHRFCFKHKMVISWVPTPELLPDRLCGARTLSHH